MSGYLSSRRWPKPGDDGPIPKRISTPAGLRLSEVMNERRQSDTSELPLSPVTPTVAPRISFSKNAGNSLIGIRVVDTDLEENSQPEAENSHQQSPHRDSPKSSKKSVPAVAAASGAPSPSSPYTQSFFSEKSAPDAQQPARKKRLGCFAGLITKRTVLLLGVLVLILLAAIVGLAVGLSKKHSDR